MMLPSSADFVPVTPVQFTEAMAQAATSVSIVTTDGPSGRFGMTVSAVASVSAEPPMVLACINRRSPAIEAIQTNAVFCINILSASQSALANCFAGRPDAGPAFDFDTASWREGVSGAPILEDAAATFDCVLADSHDAGTHRIFIGRVQVADCTQHQPLAYARRAYQALQPIQSQSRDSQEIKG